MLTVGSIVLILLGICLVQLKPLHWPQTREHSRPCLRQEHRIVAHPDAQLHLTMLRRAEKFPIACQCSYRVCDGFYHYIVVRHFQKNIGRLGWTGCIGALRALA